MIVLGIADNHDSGAAVLIDGRIVAAVNQERLDRIKGSGAFPWAAIDAALAIAGLRERDVDRIAVGTAFTPSAALRALPSLHQQRREQGTFSPLLHSYFLYQSLLRGTGLHTLEVDACRFILEHRLRARPFGRAAVSMVDHHRAHAQGAYRTQPHERCLVLTLDAMGDGTSATASLGSVGQLDLLWRQSGLAAINTFYAHITELLGFTANRHEGKVTGLAALAEAPPPLVEHLRQRLRFTSPGFNRMPLGRAESPQDPYWAELRRYSREEVAAAAQQVLEEAVLPFVRHWIGHTGCGRVAVAGGVFANVRLNQRIAELDEVESLWVMPHMGDGGLALGAALSEAGQAPAALEQAWLGPEGSVRDHYKALKRGEVEPEPIGETATRGGLSGDVERVAQLLAAGKAVARCDGRMEWGPRALGNRSIFARPHDPALTARLNAQLKRSDFMPFAPVVREEDGERWFEGLSKVRDSARYMTVCLRARPELQRSCPAAVHVDGTARPQLLRREQQPALHALLGRLEAMGLPPVLLNTSFNQHEEPIVCSSSDAVKAWRSSGVEALWMGPYVAEQG